MRLAYRFFGGAAAGADLVFLHGLFGSAQNWAGFARRIAPRARCWALDLRNHGDSPHADAHGLRDCAEDVREWIEERSGAADDGLAGPPVLVGHSMGGLVAMAVALARPSLPAAVAVLDIAPRAYPVDHEREFEALAVDISTCRTRAELDARLSPVLPDARTRSFLLTNAVPAAGGYRWRLNTAAIARTTLLAEAGELEGRYDGPALFVTAGRSDRVSPQDHERIRRLFPAARIETIPEADHWVHVTAPAELERIVEGFLADLRRD